VLCPAVHSGFAEALRHVGQVVYVLQDSCVRSSGFSLHFLAKNATSFSHSHIVSNSLKTRRASQQPKSFGKTGDYSNYGSERGLGWKRWWTGRFTSFDHTGTTAVAVIGAGETVQTVDRRIRSPRWGQPPAA
jgi:hypothetical protein